MLTSPRFTAGFSATLEIAKRLRGYWRDPTNLSPWHIDETYVTDNGWRAYLLDLPEMIGWQMKTLLSLHPPGGVSLHHHHPALPHDFCLYTSKLARSRETVAQIVAGLDVEHKLTCKQWSYYVSD